jgi:hypothetical protein
VNHYLSGAWGADKSSYTIYVIHLQGRSAVIGYITIKPCVHVFLLHASLRSMLLVVQDYLNS